MADDAGPAAGRGCRRSAGGCTGSAARAWRPDRHCCGSVWPHNLRAPAEPGRIAAAFGASRVCSGSACQGGGAVALALLPGMLHTSRGHPLHGMRLLSNLSAHRCACRPGASRWQRRGGNVGGARAACCWIGAITMPWPLYASRRPLGSGCAPELQCDRMSCT